MSRVLEVNIDDLNCGGVYILVKTIVENKPDSLSIDLASIEGFESKENEKPFIKKGCRIFKVNNVSNKLLKQYVVYENMRKLIRKEQYDCVHVHGDTANKLLTSCYAAKKEGVSQVIAHSHACGVEGNHRAIKNIIHKLSRFVLNKLNIKKVACSSLAALWMFGSAEDVEVINNGIETEKFRFDIKKRVEERHKLGVTNELLIGSVGRLCYPKNHSYMLKIAKRLKENAINYKMVFIGVGELEQNIRVETRKLGLEDAVIFYGLTDRVQDLLQAMDVFIIPSIYEGFSIAGLEAQANGIPVICSTNLPKEVCVTKNAVVLEIGDRDIDKWCELICQSEALDREKSVEKVVNAGFDIQTTLKQIIELYQ